MILSKYIVVDVWFFKQIGEAKFYNLLHRSIFQKWHLITMCKRHTKAAAAVVVVDDVDDDEDHGDDNDDDDDNDDHDAYMTLWRLAALLAISSTQSSVIIDEMPSVVWSLSKDQRKRLPINFPIAY